MHFKSLTTEIKRIYNKTLFRFKNERGKIKEIEVDETIPAILHKMENVEYGVEERVCLSNEKMNIFIEFIDHGVWVMFYKFNSYEFHGMYY
jgi:hypothetical protein